jgi:glycosyltransferase involved in cell wall biosynthesis
VNQVSAIVITKNEEKHIGACLESLSFVDEIVLVDSNSDDQTVAIARKYTQKIFNIEWKGFGETKQFALEQASHDWILWIDADERISPELASEIKSALEKDPSFSGYRMPRKAFFLGRWMRHGGWYPGYVTRLFRRERGRFDSAHVHERLHIDGPIGMLNAPILHYTDDSIHHYYEKFNNYTSLAAEELIKQGKHYSTLDLLFRPVFMFFKMYLFKAGFLDGLEGFQLAVFSSTYVFTKYAKLRELSRASKSNILVEALPLRKTE